MKRSAPKRGFISRWIRRFLLLVVATLSAGVALVLYSNFMPVWITQGRLYDDVASLPPMKVGVLLGTTDRVNGRENLFFRYRIDAAEKVWKAKKIKLLIVSGDNLNSNYNEPAKMKQALIERGLPAESIVADPLGLRTLDSIVRAKKIYGAKDLLVISQRFHNQRALYLADANGINAYGFNAQDVKPQFGFKTSLREVGARVKMWLDVHVYDTPPSHLGEKISLPL